MTAPELRIVDLGPDDDLFAGWCEVWAAAARAERPDDLPRPAREHVALGRELVAPGGSRDGLHRAALDGDAVVGALRVLFPLRDNPAVAMLDVAVSPAHRRRGLGSALVADGRALAEARGRSVLVTEVDEPGPGAPGRAFAEHLGWTCDLVETRRDLVLPVDEDRLAALEADARQASAGYEVVTWRDRTPEELLADRALLERRMTTDAPHGELPVEEEEWDGPRIREYESSHLARGRTVLSAGAVTGGRLVGFTDLQVPLAQPERASQGGTLVLREHRGHRLGTLLKVANLRRVAQRWPRTRLVSTWNAVDNAPMIAVNEALGCRSTGLYTEWVRPVPGAAGTG